MDVRPPILFLGIYQYESLHPVPGKEVILDPPQAQVTAFREELASILTLNQASVWYDQLIPTVLNSNKL